MRNFKICKEEPLDPSRTYIFCWHPHGRLFYGFAVFCGIFDKWCPELNNKVCLICLLCDLPPTGSMFFMNFNTCADKDEDSVKAKIVSRTKIVFLCENFTICQKLHDLPIGLIASD